MNMNEDDLDQFANTWNICRGDARNIIKLNKISRLNEESSNFKMIDKYFTSSNSHEFNIKLSRVWTVNREDRDRKFIRKGYINDKRLLLWHGTHNHKLLSILQYGFKRPNPSTGDVANGSMFGTGVYFADRVSKSCQYSNKSGIGLLFLCDVASQIWCETDEAHNYEKLFRTRPEDFNTIKGVGKNIPDKDDYIIWENNIIVPAGKTIANPDKEYSNSKLNYNEYVVFEPDRISIKFIVQFERK